MNDIFSYSGYEKLLKEMRKIGNIHTFNSLNPNDNTGFILRHDVDFDIDSAYKMSIVEQKSDVLSTYFVLVTSQIYNLNSKINREKIKEMHRAGFEIGLHFDPTVYSEIGTDLLEKHMKSEANVIEQIIDEKITSISLHNPTSHGLYPIFKGYTNAYDQAYFSEGTYISDSCKNFRGKDIKQFIQNGISQQLQIVLHPIHFGEVETSYINTFTNIILKQLDEFDKSMSVNSKYINELDNKSIIQYLRERSIYNE